MLFAENRKIDNFRSTLREAAITTSCIAPDQHLDEVVYIAVSLLACSMAMITDASAHKRILACAIKDDDQKSIAANDAAQRWLDPVDAERMGLVFYCDFPIRAATGEAIGYLAVYDVAHRKIEQVELDQMMCLSRIAAAMLGRVSGC
ncbi:hypothetical protein DBR17_13200 [Sphingomonas sp. HMWF008]|nr:hypothetical protein DBR17_13200 [Sphingomonas sp. HMWF008]